MPQTNTQPGTQDEDIIMSQVKKKNISRVFNSLTYFKGDYFSNCIEEEHQ